MPPARAACQRRPPRPRRARRGREPYAVVGRPRNEGHGKRLTAAFEALEVFPALAESRNRLLALIAEERPSTGDVVRAIESDVALVIAVLRLANGLDSPKRGQVESIVSAVEVLSPEAVQQLAANAETFEFFERGKTWDAAPGALPPARRRRPARRRPPRRRRPATRIATACSSPRCCTTSASSCSCTPTRATRKQVHGPARTPEERLHYERRELGVDHALVGGVLARRWNLPHVDRVRDRAPPRRGRPGRRRVRPPRGHARPLLAGLAGLLAPSCCAPPAPSASARPSCARSSTTCRTRARSARARSSRARCRRRELEVLKRLAQGMVYKQIAHELSLSHEHGAHAPAQHLRQARRGRPRPGRAARHRARLALGESPATSILVASGSQKRAVRLRLRADLRSRAAGELDVRRDGEPPRRLALELPARGHAAVDGDRRVAAERELQRLRARAG